MGDRGRGRGRGKGTAGQQEHWNMQQQPKPQMQQQHQMQPQMQPPQMQFGYDQGNQQYGFMPPPGFGFHPGNMPSPWGFPGPFPPFSQGQQFAGPSNQWIAPPQNMNQQQQSQQQTQLQPQQQQIQQQLGKQGQGTETKKTQKKKKTIAALKEQPTAAADVSVQMSYLDCICMCCGEPGHHQSTCEKSPMCFICKSLVHVDKDCPVRKRPHQVARFIGSAASGLGFFHVEVPEVILNPVASTKNCGMVIVEGGEITKQELKAEFSKIYNTNWPWQIREMGDKDAFLVKFPPHMQVEQVIGYPRFGLAKEGVWVKVEKWSDDPEPLEPLYPIWVQVTGLQSKWCEWNCLDQAMSTCGLLMDVDWLSVFRDNAQVVRVKINCKDPSKMPAGRVFEFQANTFNLGFTVEPPDAEGSDDDLLGEDLDDLSKGASDAASGGHGGMSTDSRNSTASRSTTHSQTGMGASHTAAPTRSLYVGQEELMDDDGFLKVSAVMKLLKDKGLVGDEGDFLWDKSPTLDSALEVQSFWAEEQQEHSSFELKLQQCESPRSEIHLPEDIMPTAEELKKDADKGNKLPVTKKQKWGLVQPIRQSSRFDKSKNIMEKAKERKQVTNLEVVKQVKGLGPGSPISKKLAKTVSRSVARQNCPVRGVADLQTEEPPAAGTRMSCKSFAWISSWREEAARAWHDGRAPLAYLHPGDGGFVHVAI